MKKLEIVEIVDKKDGIPENEFIIIKALEDVNLKNYAIVDNTFIITQPTNKIKLSDVFRHVYFFPDIEIEKGNYVILNSGKTKKTKTQYSEEKNIMFYIFYWNSKNCIWNNTGDEAILIEYNTQDSYLKK